MKKTNILIKAIGMMVIFSLCLPMTACSKKNNQEAGDSEVSTIAETEISEEVNASASAETSAETEEATASTVAGMYTYTLYEGTEYEMTLSMDVNVDDYIFPAAVGDNYFSFGRAARDLGWVPQGDPNFDTDANNPLYYSYEYSDGTAMIFRGGDNYNYDNTPAGYAQIYNYNVHYAPSSSPEDFIDLAHTEFSPSDHVNDGISIYTAPHPENSDIVLSLPAGRTSSASRDDVIIITYILWSASVYPTENCFSYTSLDEQFLDYSSEGYSLYSLP